MVAENKYVSEPAYRCPGKYWFDAIGGSKSSFDKFKPKNWGNLKYMLAHVFEHLKAERISV